MATFVLVHPAWFGGWCWKKLAPLLEARGHQVYRPTLTGLGERAHLARREVGLDTHVEDVVQVIEFEDLSRVILVGNSSAGLVITGVADRAPERVAQVVYLDAFVPDDGQCVFDLVPPDRRPAMQALVDTEGDGWLLPRFAAPPWNEFVPRAWRVTDEADLRWVLPRLRPTPVGHFTQPARRANPLAERLPRSYIRCLDFPHPVFDRHAEDARRSDGWTSHDLAAPHLTYVTHPAELAALLLKLAT
ncbi:MAG TPA: alpha/beta fold hydrolase [Kofleriaceae bacterium]|nr:alpha/beta fold hydrolase [Kofleriaceae bacterium]